MTAARVKKIGMDPFIVPLVEITSLEFILPKQTFDALIISSANVFKTSRIQTLAHLPLFCVGERTATAARLAGFRHIVAIAKDAKSLLALLINYPCEKFLYLTGHPHHLLFEQELTGLRKKIEVIEIYRQSSVALKSADLKHLPSFFDYALFYSAFVAQSANLMEQFFNKNTRFLCLSPRIVGALPTQYQPQARAAPNPDEASLLTLFTLPNP